MANGNIKGITIELNGDTTGLEQALADVNRESKDLQKELRSVERALKLDPGNAELVRQRQELLTQSIQQTSQKLDTLRQAQAQVQAQFDRGEIRPDQYRAFQRELAQTEGELSRFQSQLSGVQSEQDRLAQNTRDLNTFFQATGTTVDDFSARLGTRLTNAIRDGSASADQLERALNQIGRASLGAGQDLDQFRNALRNADNGAPIDEIRQDLDHLRQDVDRATDSVDKMGSKMDALGDGAMALSAGIVAAGAAAGFVATQFDTAVTKLQGQLGITAEEAERLGEVAKDVWKKGFGEDIGEVSGNLALLKQQFGDIGDEDLGNLLEAGHTLSDLFGFEVAESARTASVMAKTFGIEGQQAMDLITVAAQRGGDFNGELLDTLREYSPQFKALGYDAEGFTAILVAGAERGIFGLDKLGDAAKESFLRVGDGSKSSRDALNGLGLDFKQIEKDIQSGGETANSAFAAVASAIALVEDPAEKAALSIALFGTPLEDLGPEFRDFFASVNTDLGNFEGSTKRASDTLQQSFGERLQSTMRTLQVALEPLGTILLDLAEQWLPKIITAVEGVAKWFADLTPTMQGVTVGIGAIAAAIGPLIMIAGGLISSIGSIIGLFTSGGVAAGAFSAVIAALTGPVGLAVAAVAGIGVAVGVLANDLSQSSIEVEGWKGKVSESTSQAVGSFMELSDGATVALNQMKWSGTAVTQEMATSISETFANMGNQVLSEMQTDHAEQLTELQNFYAQSSVLSDEQETEAIAKMQTYHQNRQQVITDGMARINEILTTAYNEQRETTLAEEAEMDRIKQQMQEAAITHMSESAEEQKVILEALKNEASEITAVQAAEVVKNSAKQKDETIAEAQKQYEESLKIIMQQRDETGAISEEQAQLMINEAQRTRDETVKSAEEMHTNVVTEAKAQADEHVNQVDWTTGEIKSKWQVMKDDTVAKMKETGAAIKRDWTNAYNDTVKWAGNIVSSVGKFFSDKVKTVETKMAEVKQKIESKWGEATTFLKGIDLIQIGKDIVNGLIEGIGKKFDGVKKKVEELAGLIPEWAKDILGIHSPSRVMRELGEWVGIGLANGIESTEQLNQKMMQHVTDGILGVKKSFKDQSVKLDQDLAKAIQNTNEKANDDIEKIQKAAASKKRALTTDEVAKIQKLRSQAAENILKLEEKAVSDRSKLAVNEKKEIENKYKDLLGSIKSFISDKKSLDQLSLKDEILVWEQSLSLFEGANDQRIAAQKEYKNALQALNDEIVSINKTYTDKINTINEDLIKKENELTKAYDDEFNKRYNTYMNAVGLFDEFKSEIQKSGQELLNNLQSQVDGFKQWQDEFAKLSSRNIDADLLAELSDLGVKALPELMALNQLTDEQLTQYSALYQEKAQLARTQAETELIGMKTDTQAKIAEMRKAANTELSKLQSDWAAKIKGVTEGTNTELSTLKQIGVNAGTGLLEGLSSTAPALYAKAQEIADTIASTIAAALQIHSPSRVTMGFGVNINEGLIKGMEQSSGRLQAAMNNVYGSLASSAEKSVAFGAAQYNTSSSTSTTNTENHYHFTVSSPRPLDPYETARLSKNALKEMGLQF